ncbi:hypothetical protein BH11BAC2_BH11BAC2_07770 [soil metagenome]
MNHELTVSETVLINADPAQIWEVLTNPDLIKEYLYGTNTVTDWKPGSEIVFQGEWEGKSYKDKGVILENIKNKLIKYSYWSGFSGLEDKPENYNLVIYSIAEKENGNTAFTWTQIGFASEEAQAHSANGMKGFLGSIKSIVERISAEKL